MKPELIVLIVSNITNFILGGLILVRNRSSKVNRSFALLSFTTIVWTSFNYLADHTLNNHAALLETKLTLIMGAMILLSVNYLSLYFPNNNVRKIPKATYFQVAAAVLISALILSSFVVKGVKVGKGHGVNVEVGLLYALYVAYLVQGIFFTIRNFFHTLKSSNSAQQRSQVKLLLSGLLLFAIFTIVSNVILPIILDSWSSSTYGPISTLFVVGLTAYAIIRYKLFDIRLIIARVLGYVGSLGIIASVYGFIFLGLTKSVLNFNLPLSAQIALSVGTGVAGLFFGRIKRLFDQITNRIFYQDAYDTSAFLDELNKSIIDNIELRILLRRVSEVIINNIKCESATFILFDDLNKNPRFIDSSNSHPGLEGIMSIKEEIDRFSSKVIAYDDISDKSTPLRRQLREGGISVISKLAGPNSDPQVIYNYMVLGDKRSGNPYTKDDLRVIEIIGDELTLAIQNALRFEEIQNFNVSLQQKINDATKRLRKANEKLKDLDETKDDFISMASHQLRTPLTSIKGYTSMLLEGDAGELNQTQKDMLSQAFYSSQRMVYLISDMLNVSRLKTGKFIIERSSVNLADVVQQEINQLVETAAAKDITITYNRPESFPSLMIDETKTRQVIMNFSDNAIYYTPQGGHIDIELIDKPSSIELRVKDNGIGVPKSEQHHLFTKFYRANNARKARPDGTGLGLYMAKKVIIAQGGAVIFESEEGKGSTFGFTMSKTPFQKHNPIPQTDEIIAHSLK